MLHADHLRDKLDSDLILPVDTGVNQQYKNCGGKKNQLAVGGLQSAFGGPTGHHTSTAAAWQNPDQPIQQSDQLNSEVSKPEPTKVTDIRPQRTSGAATIMDVANLAGVSKKTVSRVLNSEPNVRPATRDKVLAAIDQLKFRRSRLGLALAHNRSYMIALVYDNPSANFLTHLQAGVMSACKSRGIGLYLHKCSYDSPTLVDDMAQMIGSTAVDGLVLPSPVCDQEPLLELLEIERVPYVCVNPRDQQHAMSVSVNNEQSAFELTEYLAGIGHTKIAFIKGHPALASSARRESGFRRAMAKHGIAVDEALLLQGMNDFESGRAAAGELLGSEERPTAIFANNDEMAAGVLYELQSHDLRVPDDISLIGFDNTPFSQQVWPRLTTAGQPIAEMGTAAAAMLIDNFGGSSDADSDTHVTMECEILIRESSDSIRS